MTRPASLRSRRWRETAGLLMGSASAISRTVRPPEPSSSKIARRFGSPSASKGSPFPRPVPLIPCEGNIAATVTKLLPRGLGRGGLEEVHGGRTNEGLRRQLDDRGFPPSLVGDSHGRSRVLEVGLRCGEG